MSTDNSEQSNPQQQEELSAYDKMLHEVKNQLERSKADAHALREVIDQAAAELREIGAHSGEAILKASAALKKDLASSAERTKPLFETLEHNAEQAAEALHQAGAQLWTQLATASRDSVISWRDWTGGSFESLLHKISEVSGKLGGELGEALTYHTGEMTYGGTFRCIACGATLTLKAPGHLPPCPKCHQTAFRHT